MNIFSEKKIFINFSDFEQKNFRLLANLSHQHCQIWFWLVQRNTLKKLLYHKNSNWEVFLSPDREVFGHFKRSSQLGFQNGCPRVQEDFLSKCFSSDNCIFLFTFELQAKDFQTFFCKKFYNSVNTPIYGSSVELSGKILFW